MRDYVIIIGNIFVIIKEIEYHTWVEFLLTLSIVLIKLSCMLKMFGEDLLKLGEKKTRGQLNAFTFFFWGGNQILGWRLPNRAPMKTCW